MKKIYYLLVILTGFIWVSCGDFLEKDPESSYSESTSYKSQADFEYAIAGVYAAQQDLFKDKGSWFWVMSERSDDIRYDSNMQYHKLGLFTDGDDESTVNTFWGVFWRIISRSNIILGKIDNVDFQDQEMKKYITGEAHALRGWAYYTLGWLFGGMPLIEDYTLSATEVLRIARSTQEETFDFAEKDFLQAIEFLPDTWGSEYAGRVTKYAAMAGLARLYMFRAEYSNAKPLLQNVINSGIYGLAKKYEDCFTDKYDNDPHLLQKVTVEDIRSFGMIPEFIGRLPIIFTLDGLNEDMLVKILQEPKNAILKQYQKLLALDEVKLEFEDGALHAIAAKALERDTGARALRAILEEYMLDIMYEIPKDDSIGEVVITREYIEGNGGPRILLRGQEPILLEGSH